MRIIYYQIIFILFAVSQANAQLDSILSRIDYEMDFRFRVEQDWDSKKSDGSFRKDRTRLRYRFRTGMSYKNDWYTMGFRIRTGDQNKQQDPQLTLGQGFEEFGTLPLGFEKIFFKGEFKKMKFWLGKNTYSFEKNNELFWSDNVFPEGVFIERNLVVNSNVINKIYLRGGHFVLSSNGRSLLKDAYFQGLQTSVSLFKNRLKIFPALYLFRNIPNIPDGGETFELDYTIFHVGSKFQLLQKSKLSVEMDFYQNLQDYSLYNSISDDLVDEKMGYTIGLHWGTLKTPKTWMFNLCYASLERYAIVDFMAQNDWARWDYSSTGSPDGRLSNFHGVEFVVAYAISEKVNLVTKYYYVEQLISLGVSKETGQRFRVDLNVKI